MILSVFWLAIIRGDGSTSTSTSTSHVFSTHGVLLKNHGEVYLNSNEEYFSVFVKLALPQFRFKDLGKDCWKYFPCANGAFNKSCGPDEFYELHHIRNLAVIMTKERVREFDMLISQRGSRSKRDFLGALGMGIGVFGMLFSGVSSARMTKHINDLKDNFEQFKTEQRVIDDRLVKFQLKSLQIIDHHYKMFEMQLKGFSCVQAAIFQYSARRFYLAHWEKMLDGYFSYILQGTLGGKLTSSILSIEDLKTVIRDHQNLQSTIYSKNLMNFYLTSKIVMVESGLVNNDRELCLHYVLQVPMLYSFNAFPLFKVERVPIVIKDRRELVNLPRFMYLRHRGDPKESKFTPLHTDSCLMTDLVSVCYETVAQSTKYSACLYHGTNCTFSLATTNDLRYVYDYSGTLISGKGDVYYLKRGATPGSKRIFNVPFSTLGTLFISWERAEYVQYLDVRITAPYYRASSFNYSLETTMSMELWLNHLIQESNKLVAQHNISELSQELVDLKSTLIQGTVTCHRATSWIAYFALGCSVISWIILGILLARVYSISNCRLYHMCRKCTDPAHESISIEECGPTVESPVSLSVTEKVPDPVIL